MDFGKPIGEERFHLVVQIESRESLLRRIRAVEDWYPDQASILRRLLEEPGLAPVAQTIEIAVTPSTHHVRIKITPQ